MSGDEFTERFTKEQLDDLGMLGACVSADKGTLTFRFTDHDQVWTRVTGRAGVAPSPERLRFNGVVYEHSHDVRRKP